MYPAGSFKDAVTYTFPASTIVKAGQYLVIAQNVDVIKKKYNLSPAVIVGPYQGKLDNQGDILELYNAAGELV